MSPEYARRSDLPPIELKPRNQWGQGSPDHMEYCPQCRTNTLPKNGCCMWCDGRTIRRTSR